MKLKIIEGHLAHSSLFQLTAVGSGLGMLPFFVFGALILAFDTGSTLFINDVEFTGLTASSLLVFWSCPAQPCFFALFVGSLIWLGIWMYSLKKPVEFEYEEEGHPPNVNSR